MHVLREDGLFDLSATLVIVRANRVEAVFSC